MAKYIFVTGGVVSSLGKGITAASIGLLLKSRGLNVINQKFDPYLNVDPGTMNPYQHGEVYVTDDGAETDLDLGHYERFTGITTNRNCNYTTGRIYDAIIRKERRGDYLGGTVQVVPHVTTEICDSIRSVVTDDVDVVISEIGGTVGDIESLPFLEALRLFRLMEGRSNVLFVHVTLIPYLSKAGEVKTKPTQHSVGRLREIGIIPDVLICRTEKHLDAEVRRKISLFCNVDTEAVIEAFDVENTIYEVPMHLAEQNLDYVIIDTLGLRAGRRNLKPWRDYIDRVVNATKSVSIAVVGKYSELLDAYKSIREALQHAAAYHSVNLSIETVAAEDIELEGPAKVLRGVSGILVPGGFGSRGLEGKIAAIRFAREKKIPFFGICLGMQTAVIEFARNVLKLADADSMENHENTPHPVIHLMEEQKRIMNLGGTMRLGAYPCVLTKGSIARKAYGKESISERHRHRYEFNNEYREACEKQGMVLSGLSPNKMLVEIVELKDHPWFVGCQFHPEFKSRPIDVHPLFRDFIGAGVKQGARRGTK
ncbi:MAG: CTP synthase [Chitinivibrionales bacterium]|nr:CTP synthase [Chitinivibrionales bacterium]MBD3394285.1 CTP synthase [Chitinivibrionales bacterium]